MYTVGEAVATYWDGQRQLGEIVGVFSVGGRLLYDVSLEFVVVKALEEKSIQAVAENELRNILMALLNGPQVELSLRQAVLRKRHVEFLTRALAVFEQNTAQDMPHAARFEVGQQVAAHEDNAWLLGTVRSVLAREGELQYDVEVQDELCRYAEHELAQLEEVDVASTFALGARVAFLAEGFEGNEDFLGTVCSVAPGEFGAEYAIMFDDGDVMEYLSAADLALA